MTAGPPMTANNAGRMNSANGNTIFVAATAAFFSAAWRRLRRIDSE